MRSTWNAKRRGHARRHGNVIRSRGPFASGYLETAAGNGIRGANGDWGFGIVFGKTQDQAGGIDYVCQCGLLASNRGWYIAITSAGAVVVRVHDGAGVLQTSAPGTALSNRWNALIVQGRSGEIRSALNGAGTWTSSGTFTGYSAPDAADTFVIGSRSAGATPFEYGRVAACGGSDTVRPTDTDRAAWFSAVRGAIIARRGWSNLAATAHAWSGQGLDDKIGDHGLTNQSAPLAIEDWAPAW